MARLAFVPVRGGSQSIPLKNIKEIAGRPLLWWTLRSLEDATSIDEVVVATDSDQIEQMALSFGFTKTRVYRRQTENATNTASTESVMLEFLTHQPLMGDDHFILVQATNPFTTANDFDQAFALLSSSKADSLLTVVRTKRFFWSLENEPLNYNPTSRPRRQDYDGLLMENGAFYIQSVHGVLKHKNRLGGKIVTYEMPEHSGFEIDEPDDWTICAELLKKHRGHELKTNKPVRAFISDIDGVLTDAGMYYSEQGDELKKFHTRDGMGLKLIQARGVKIGFITSEDRELNSRRAKKLGLDFIVQGAKNKLEIAQRLCQEWGISLEECSHIGDDVNDLELLMAVGHKACPADALDCIKAIPGIQIMSKPGGQGAVREWVEKLMSSQL